MTFGAIFKNITFHEETVMATFCATLGKFGLLLISISGHTGRRPLTQRILTQGEVPIIVPTADLVLSFVWIQLLCLCWLRISFTCLVKSKPAKQEVTRSVILPSMVSVYGWHNEPLWSTGKDFGIWRGLKAILGGLDCRHLQTKKLDIFKSQSLLRSWTKWPDIGIKSCPIFEKFSPK